MGDKNHPGGALQDFPSFADLSAVRRSAGSSRLLLVSLAFALCAIVAVVLFANATTASRIARNAEELHWSNATLGTAALARASAGQLALFEELIDSGFADTEALETATLEVERASAALRDLTNEAGGEIRVTLLRLIDSLEQRPMPIDEVDALYREVAPALQDQISDLEAAIARSDRVADFAYGAVRLVVILIVPAIVIFAYRRRANLQLREAQIQVEAQLEAEREISRAKDDFVSGMSHEIRTPLTGIRGFAEVLLESPPGPPVDRDYVRVIYSEAADLSRMVDDFIVASRIYGGDLEIRVKPIDLLEVAKSVADVFRRKGITVRVVGEPMAVMCDPGRARHILTNLVANGIQHGGRHVSVRLEDDDGWVRANVTDDGNGVPPEIESRLFTRYVHEGPIAFTAGSLGLGTWVSRELARAMGGDVVYERTGNSTCFGLSLPVAPAASAMSDGEALSGVET